MSERQSKRKRFDPERRQTAILDAAERLFASNGYEGTSTTQIAKEADVAVGTIFKHFGDKPSLLAALHRRLEAEFVEAMTEAWLSQADYAKKFRAMYRALFNVAERRRDVMPVYAMTKELSNRTEYRSGQEIVLRIQELYAAGVEERELVAYPADMVASMMHGMVDGAMRAWMDNPTAARKSKAIKTLADVSKQALCATPD